MRIFFFFLVSAIVFFKVIPVLQELPEQAGSIFFPQQEVRNTSSQLVGKSFSDFFLARENELLKLNISLSGKSATPTSPVNPHSSKPQSLIDWQLQHLIYIGVFILAIGIIIIIGLLNQRIEHAIVFSLILSIILIIILWHL